MKLMRYIHLAGAIYLDRCSVDWGPFSIGVGGIESLHHIPGNRAATIFRFGPLNLDKISVSVSHTRLSWSIRSG